jgi:hypothetical protein
MTRSELEQENTLLRVLVTQYQMVAWLRTNAAGEPLRNAYLRLTELERWAALAGIFYRADRASTATAETILTCSTCGDRLAVSGGRAACAAGIGYFRTLHSSKRCRVETVEAVAA